MKILNFGSCNIDYVYSLDHIVTAGETETTFSREIFPGGKGLNQSIAIAKGGAKVYHAGIIGNNADVLKNVMKESGVDISYLKEIDEENGHAVIQVSSTGENSIFLYPGSNEKVTPDYIDTVLANFEKGDVILLQNEISNVDYIVDKAYEKQMIIILNPSPYNEKIERIDFSKLSYVILNQVEACDLAKCQSPEDALKILNERYPNLKILLTLGSRGSMLKDGDEQVYQSAYLVDTVDTTAAGDTFTGYFIAEITNQAPYSQALKLASAASAIAVSKKGASSSIPYKSEVLEVIDNMPENDFNPKSDSIKRQIDTYIEKNIKTANLDELSKNLGYSTVYTGTLIKKLTGKSFSDIILSKRCSIAADKLLNTDLPVDEIISGVGYENKSFFRKMFKEKYGKTPLQYRKK